MFILYAIFGKTNEKNFRKKRKKPIENQKELNIKTKLCFPLDDSKYYMMIYSNVTQK